MGLLRGAEPFYFPGGPVGAVLIHGFTGAPREVRPLGEALAQAGVACAGVRLAHHGARIEDMFRSVWRDWHFSALDGYHLLREHCATIFAVGLSMGGALALLLAAELPLAGVVTLSTPSRPRLEALDWRARYARWFSLFIPFVDKGPADEHADPQHVHYPRYPVRAIGELRALLVESSACLPRVRAPALIIHSRRDASVTPANAEYIHQHLGSRDKQLLWLERSGHIVTEGPERAAVQAAVTRFVQATSPAPA
jgi:carboxylesterase